MSDAPSLTRLPGRMRLLRISAAPKTTLWLGEHALIASELTFYKESYRQFDYASIQGLVMRRTPRWIVVSVILAAIAGCFGAAAVSNPDAAVKAVYGAFAVFWIALLSINVLRGPTCRVELQTAVGRRELPTLNRVRVARRAIASIAQEVERVQGALAPADAEGRMNAFLRLTPAG